MRRIPVIIATAGSLTLVAAPVAGASTSQTSSATAATEHQVATSKVAQYQGSRQNNQQYNQQYNKQDYSKRRSWGGG
jgi:Ni/Co efflux regulator RcnB